jgi:short-subunit dehydrogenase
MRKLENKVVIVTGASSGIGEAIARLFAAEGARLALVARSFDKLEALARSLGSGAVPIRADMANPAEVREMVRLAAERFGRVDILINNAGVGMYASFADAPPEQIEHLIRTNWLGPMHAVQAVVPHMRKQGGGQIINISSVAGKISIPWMATYCSTKFALNALSYSLRMELEEEDIQVISVCPGRIRTPFTDNAFKDRMTMPLRPGGISAERVARAVLRASLANRREIVVPGSNRVWVWLHDLFLPYSDWAMVRIMRRGMRKRSQESEIRSHRREP